MGGNEFDNRSGGRGRKFLLFVVLVAVVGAFVYDLAIVKPDFRKGVEELKGLMDPLKGEDGKTVIKNGRPVPKGDQDGDGVVSPADVHKVAGQDPSRSWFMKTDSDVLVEVYSWKRGIPLLSYDAFAVYKKFNNGHRLYSVNEIEPDESSFGDPILPGKLPEGLKRAGGGNADESGDAGKKEDEKEDEKKDEESSGASGKEEGSPPPADSEKENNPEGGG